MINTGSFVLGLITYGFVCAAGPAFAAQDWGSGIYIAALSLGVSEASETLTKGSVRTDFLPGRAAATAMPASAHRQPLAVSDSVVTSGFDPESAHLQPPREAAP